MPPALIAVTISPSFYGSPAASKYTGKITDSNGR